MEGKYGSSLQIFNTEEGVNFFSVAPESRTRTNEFIYSCQKLYY